MARYIDEDKLLEDLQEEIDFETTMYTEEQNKWFNIGLKCAVRNVRQQPTADVVEVKHGEWIMVKELCGIEVLKCSICGTEHSRLPTAYCCDCGAKMDGGET